MLMGKLILPIALAFGSATAAKADTWSFPFSFDYSSPNSVSVQGSFITGDDGGLATSAIQDWDVDFTTPTTFGPLVLDLNSANSNLLFNPGTTTQAQNFSSGSFLQIIMADKSQGFDLSGTATVSGANGDDQYFVEWTVGENLDASQVFIEPVSGAAAVLGYESFPIQGVYPVVLTTDQGSVQVGVGVPSPVPEPSSLLLFGTGALSLGAAGLRRCKMIRSTQNIAES
jgi:hypothetical protein